MRVIRSWSATPKMIGRWTLDCGLLFRTDTASGKKLTTIYVSHGDPDYYFGLDVLQDAFPDVNAPLRIVIPSVLEGRSRC